MRYDCTCMKGFEQHIITKRDPVRLLYRRMLIVFCLVLLVVLVRSVWNMYGKSAETAQARMAAEVRLEELQGRKRVLETTIADLRSDRGVETQLRERYALGSEGEGLVIVVDDAPKPQKPRQEFPPLTWLKSIWPW